MTDLVLIACLCADWCGVCREFRGLFDAAAAANPALRFAWIDIEDHPEVAGEVDIETFPTLLASSAGGRGFFGAIEPREAVLQALIDNLLRGAFLPDAQVAVLNQRARAHLAALG